MVVMAAAILQRYLAGLFFLLGWLSVMVLVCAQSVCNCCFTEVITSRKSFYIQPICIKYSLHPKPPV